MALLSLPDVLRLRAAILPRRRFLAAAVATAGASWCAPSLAFANDDAWKGLLGTFKYTGGAHEDAARVRAIDDVVDRMNLIARGIARSRLRDATVIAPCVSLAVDGKLLTVADGKRTDTAPTDGTAVKVTAFNGDEMELSYRLGDTEILQSFSDGAKGSIHSFTLADDALVVRHAIFASQLPAHIVYFTTYARVD